MKHSESFARTTENEAREAGSFHKTLLVKSAGGDIVGKLCIYDLIRGLVPEPVRKEAIPKAHQRTISTREAKAVEEFAEIQERFQWLATNFSELVQKESQKKARDVMSPIHPLLKEDDTINRAIYVLKLEDMDGIEVLRIFRKMDPLMPVIMVTGHGSETAAKAGDRIRGV